MSSSLHQKLKLVTKNRLIAINAEKIIASLTNDVPYIDTDKTTECSFKSLEFVNTTFVTKENKILTLKMSTITQMSLKIKVRREALPKKELGKFLQGGVTATILTEKQDNFWL